MEILWWGVLISARLLPGVLLVDGFGGRRMPWPAALSLAACGAVLVFPYSGFYGTAPEGLTFLGLILKEICVGCVLAAGASVVFHCLKMAGQVMDGVRGAGRSESAIMPDGSKGSSLAMLYTILASVIFLQMGGAQILLKAVVASFHMVPVMSVPSAGVLSSALEWLVGVSGIAIETAVWLAWPVMASMIFTDLVLGAVCRSAPQLPVYFIGLPLKSSIAVLMAALLLTRAAPAVSHMLTSVTGP